MFKKIFFTVVLSVLVIVSTHTYARTYNLTLIDQDKRIEIPFDELRSQANLEFVIYEPFEQRDIKIQGILLDDLLMKYLSKLPEKLTFSAIDGYQVIFDTWKKNHWVIVTSEDGKSLTIRDKGPLKVIEKSYDDKNLKNLRDFNDWVWMLKEIQVQP